MFFDELGRAQKLHYKLIHFRTPKNRSGFGVRGTRMSSFFSSVLSLSSLVVLAPRPIEGL